jgi:hypothetical protein
LSRVGELQVFPPDNPWNQAIDHLPVHPNSDQFIASVGLDANLHPDFGGIWEGVPVGIPYCLVTGDHQRVPVTFQYQGESDPGPYPLSDATPIEGGPGSQGDRHVIVIDTDAMMLYELFQVVKTDRGWSAAAGAIFNLRSNELRPAGWTSADAAGLPIFPGLVRYEEIEKGEIDHALRFTVRRTQRAYIHPARHWASTSRDPALPPMGLRVRLKADYDISGFSPACQVILRALKKYGMLLADNGGNWFISGSPDPRWDTSVLAELKKVKGRDLEAVETGEIVQ